MLMANLFAEQVGLSLANLRRRDALRNQSIRDPLSGLFNRVFWKKPLNARFAGRFARSRV